MSAQVKAAKDALDQAVTAYKHSKAMITKSLDSAAPNERTLNNKMKSLNEALSMLNSRHTSWSMKAEFTDELLAAEKYSTTWLEAEWAAVDDIQDRVDEKLSSTLPASHTNEQKLDICCKQMETLQLDIKTKIDNLLAKTGSNVNSASFKVYEDMLTTVQNCFAGDFSDLAHNMSLDQVDVAKRCLEFEEFRRTQQEKIVVIQLQFAENIPPPPSSGSASGIKSVEMEKSKAPSFSGKTIEYPEFKRGWRKVAGVVWDDGNQVEQIKFKVDLDTRRMISRCNTMDEVWKVLDAEYAQEQEVINAVDEELRTLKTLNCTTPEYIVKLRNYLPNLEEALRNVEGLDHLCSPDRVNYLATKFDDRTMYDWDYFRSKASGTTYERFFKFLLDRYDAARTSIARSNSKAKLLDRSSQEHSSNHLVSHTNVADGTECRRCRTWIARDSIYTCPGCGRGTAIGERILHCLEHCGAYMRMSVIDRSTCVEKAKWCPVHLLGTHSLSECNMVNDSKFICGVDSCKKHHHKTLHGSTTPFVANIHTTQCINESSFSGAGNVLLSIQPVPTTTGSANCLFDSGASCCLITKSAAEHLHLTGEPMSLTITTVNGTRTLDSFAYTFPLIDKDNERHLVTALEVESISDNIVEVDISGVKHIFSSEVQEKWDLIKSRPKGEIDLLLGQNVCGLHPVDFESRGNLKILSSLFGCGFVLTGTHPAIRSQKIIWNEDVSNIRHFASTSHDSPHVYANRISVKPNYEYFELDNLGVPPPRRCGNCLNCKDCSFRGQMLSQQEQYEYQVLESKVKYDPPSQSSYVSYPFIEDPSILPDNKGQVIKIAEREENRLIKSGLLDDFNQEFNKMMKHGALIELSPEEMVMWHGPTHYVSLQHVINEDSTTTPIRIVTNSSLSDRRGISLNSILMKGPNTLSDQWAVLNRWRSYEVAMCSDVTKAYYSLCTGEVEKHVRRVCWRYGQQNSDWRVFAFCTVSFGDRPAAAFLEIAIKRTAELNNHIDPEAAFRILNDRYVDDFASGGSPSQVSRFIGNENEDFQCDGTLPTILSKGSLRLKVIVASGERNEQKVAKLGGKVLGLQWNPSLDEISIDLKVSLNTNKKNNGKLTLSPHSLDTFDKSLLTTRNLLGIVNGVYDPLGLVAPITTRLRVAFRDLFQNESLKWDDPIPPGSGRYLWFDLIPLLVHAGKVSFPRATKPANIVGKCQLICFFDGSDVAYAAAIYIRWTLSDHSVVVTLLCAKSRVTPLQRISTPRSELNGAILASRLLLSSLRSLSSSDVIPERVWMIGDSECTLASLEKVNAAFGEYFGNRIGEIIDAQAKIEQICPVGQNGEWWHTSSHNNAADRATRLDSMIQDIGVGSEWQTGPPFLKRPPSEWPINRDFAERKDEHIPQSELLKRFRCLIQNVQAENVLGVNQLIDPFSTNYWDKLINKTQLLLIPFHKKKYGSTDDASRIASAKRIWFLTAMADTVEALNAGKLKELDVQDVDGMKVVCGRASTGLQKFFGRNHLPVVMGRSRVAYLLMLRAHCKDHAGRDVTMAMSRHDAWIVNAKRLAKKIVKNCIRCRFLRKQLEGQKMAVIPAILQVPSPPFTNIGVDLCGPFTVKSMTNKRSTMKVWVVIFLCLNTKAISMELSPGYSTDDFLIAYSSHASVRGTPSFVHSDRGSQLVAAHKDLCDDPLRYDWDVIASSTATQGTAWKFAPAGGQWRNGAAESFVKKFKLSFCHLYRETKFNYAELACAVKRISNVLNDRPVSVQRTKSDAQDEDFLSPLTPNMLLTGRNANDPPREYVDFEDPQLRKSFIEELEAAWWYQYKVQYFDSLIPTRKWVETCRNMSVGDVVLIQYSSKSAPGTYRLGRVTEVEVDDDGLVRTCTVKYNLIKPVNTTNQSTVDDVVRKEVRVPVQRLVLILPVEEQ